MINKPKLAVIFDMDGVIIDNTKYHALAWQQACKKFGKTLTLEQVKNNVLGRFNREVFAELLGYKPSKSEARRLALQKEAYYRKIYAHAIKPLAGVRKFLDELKSANIKVAIATAAPPVNVKWVMARTKLKKYFKIIVDDTGVKKGKPAPDIFLKVAKKLKVSPKNCVVFEDGMLGIKAGLAAKMKVVGVATSHKPQEIKHTDLVIKDFREINLDKLLKLF